jgi:hypothetical protein
MSTTTPVKIGTPTSVISHPTFKAQGKTYWEIQFREDSPNGTPNVLSVIAGITPPDLGKPIIYTSTPLEHASGPINKIEWPVSPQLIPSDIRAAYEKLRGAGVVEEVTMPIENPVEATKGEVTTQAPPESTEKPYKSPDRDALIVRQVAAKLAVEYFSNSPNHPEQPMLAMKLQAEQWEQWIMRSAQ